MSELKIDLFPRKQSKFKKNCHWHSLKSFNNLQVWKKGPTDRTIKVDTYLKSLNFSTSNCEYYNSPSRSFWISNCIHRMSCMWDPNDRTVKVDTYLKSPNFSASQVEYRVLQLSQFIWIFGCIHKIFCIWDPNDRTVKVDTYLKRANRLFRVHKRHVKWEGTSQTHKSTCDTLMLLNSTKISPVAAGWNPQLLAYWIGKNTFQKVCLT